ncbi:MAG: helical backbone metal receptor [Vicingaceae bacterium]|nr:helical backbone metal receptor [Vicingaceae bacterium]
MLIIDQINHQFELTTTPKRIISLVPSQTELLYDLGLDDKVVGITKFCIHPKEWFNTKIRVGGTKTVNFEKISELKPDLIIANKEENTQSEIEVLQKLYPVYTSDIFNLDDSLKMMEAIGEVTNTSKKATQIINQVKADFDSLKVSQNSMTVLYFIWQKPYMTIGSDTFINDMLSSCGFKNALTDKTRYPELTEEEIKDINPDLIFLSSEPFPFKEKHVKIFQETCPEAKVVLVDGEMFSWYGSRLTKAKQYFVDLIEKLA